MNLRQTIQVNKPLEKNNRFKLIDFFDETNFNMWIEGEGATHHLVSIGYLTDMVSKNSSRSIESVMHHNDNGSDMYSYRIKVLYQEK